MDEDRPTESLPTPAYSPPTAAPAAATPEPPVAWAPPPPPPMRSGGRSTLSLVAGIVLMVLGILGVLAALAVFTIGREIVRRFYGGEDPALVASVLTYGGIVLLVFSGFYVIGGVGAARSKDWGRITGIVIGILGSLFWLAGVGGAGRAGPRDDVAFAFVLLALHAYVAIALLFFWRGRAPA